MASVESETYTGRCICGELKYEVEIATPNKLAGQAICHCIFCKRMTGSCFSRSFATPLTGFKWTYGQPKEYIHISEKDKGSDPPKSQPKWYFCPTCATQIHAVHDALPGQAILRVGTLDRQGEFEKVVMQLNCESENSTMKEQLNREDNRFDTFPKRP